MPVSNLEERVYKVYNSHGGKYGLIVSWFECKSLFLIPYSKNQINSYLNVLEASNHNSIITLCT